MVSREPPPVTPTAPDVRKRARESDSGDDARPPLRPAPALALMAAVVAVWGVNWPIMKVALADIPPLSFALARLALGALCLFAVLAALRRLRLPPREDWPVVATVGLLQLAAFLALINLGLARVEAGRAAILAYTTLIWVTPIAVAFLGEKLTPAKTAGLGLGLGGVAVLFNPLAFDWSDARTLTGNGFLLAGALAWALTIVHVRGHRFRLTPLQLAPWQMAVGAVPVAVLAVLLEDMGEIRPGTRLWLALAYNGPVATAFALWAWVTVNRALPAITTAMASLAVPVVGVAAAALLLGERITASGILGLVLILAGLAAISAETARRPASPAPGTPPGPRA